MTVFHFGPRRFRTLTAGALLGAMVSGGLATAATADAALADLVEQVSPSVVTILARQEAGPAPNSALPFDPEDHPFGEFFRRFGAPDGLPAPRPGPRQGLGSGFVIGADGLIVTNHHVIDGAESVTVRLSDARSFEAEIIGSDPLTDLALLRIDADGDLPVVELGDSDAIRVGEDVVAIGNPFGLSSTVTAGIVSAKGRNISDGPYAEFLQTDAAINRGNSGGPLFNMAGEVVGVNSAIFSPTGGSVGLGFAVTSNIVETVVADLSDDGQIDRGWLGVSIQNVDPDIAAAMGLDGTGGALVADVIDGSPADGVLQPGDVIVAFNGSEVGSSADLPRLVGATKSGTAREIGILRDGSAQTVEVVIGAFEARAETGAKAAAESEDKTLGVSVAVLTDQIRGELGLGRDVKGVVVTDLDPDGPAARAGLRRGDVIVRFGTAETPDPQALRDALAAQESDPVLVLINRRSDPLFVAVELG